MPDTTSEMSDCKPGPPVHIVVRATGEYSDREVAIVGVYSDIDIEKARALAEDMKAGDRAAYVVSKTWHNESAKRCTDRGLKGDVGPHNVDEAARAVGMEPRSTNFGSDDSEYTVVSIPLNEAGEWLL